MVSIQHVSKVYSLYDRPADRLVSLLPIIGEARGREFWALRDVNLRVEPGEVFALVGPNGSGKSTLLQIVAGIMQPSRGRVVREGRVAALLELGAGFNPDFSGRENVFLNGEIMGLSRADVEAAFPKIAEFAGIGDFMDRPVKEYSSGMYVRLAFSTAIHVDPEVLIVDEALAVGDAIFANKCVRKLEELKERKVTILFVSHDLGIVKRLADRAALMMNGQVAAVGKPSDIVNRYVGLVHELQLRDAPEEGGSYRHGDGTSRIVSVAILNSQGLETSSVLSGERARIRLRAEFSKASVDPMVGMLIRNRLGVDVYGTNTRVEKVELGSFAAGDVLEIEFAIDCLLSRQEYTLTVATQHADGASQDWIDDALSFAVVDHRDTAGMIQLNTEIQWRRNP
ncbi:MAG TPA: ABC transporter ATP-binding protein [Bryobacteraceae bacterium]|nr:ABC transporter ATP-binding protein [Bryobacteraceae bacterium]